MHSIVKPVLHCIKFFFDLLGNLQRRILLFSVLTYIPYNQLVHRLWSNGRFSSQLRYSGLVIQYIAMHIDSIEAGLEVPLHHIVMLIYSLNYDFYHHKQITFIIITS